MRHVFRTLAITTSLAMAGAAGAESEPADAQIKAALYDIERAEAQLPTLTPARAASIKRLERSLGLTEQRLNDSTHRSHPSWEEASERLEALKQALARLADGGEGDPDGSQRDGADQAQPVKTPAGAPTTAPRAELVSGERAKVRKLGRDIDSARDVINRGGIKPFQSPAYVAKWESARTRYRKALARYLQFEDPDVEATAKKLEQFERLFELSKGEAAKQLAQLGDVQATLRQIERDLRANPAPQSLLPPFDEATAIKWLSLGDEAKRVARTSLAQLQRIAPIAYLPRNRGTVQSGAEYDDLDLDRLARAAQETELAVDREREATSRFLELQLQAQRDTLDRLRALDPEDPDDVLRNFLSEGAEERTYATLDRAMALANSALALERATGEGPSSRTLARVQDIAHLRTLYSEQRSLALGESRLPEAKSHDPELMAIARKILADPGYEFGEHGPVVLTTAGVIEREKQVSRTEYNDVDLSLSGTITLSGTEETWQYRWREFKFAAPLRDAGTDRWHLWWITAKNYSSGWAQTPIGVWVSGGAVQGSEILPDKFE